MLKNPLLEFFGPFGIEDSDSNDNIMLILCILFLALKTHATV